MHDSGATRFTTVLLAAGDSSRMGEDKAMLPYGEHCVVEVLVARCRAAGAARVYVCTSEARRDALEALVGDDDTVVLAVPEDARARGPVASIRRALEAGAAQTEDCLIWPIDHPFVRRSTLVSLASADGVLRQPTYEDRGGHPIFVEAGERDRILAATQAPGSTLRDYVQLRRAVASRVPVGDPAVLWNCDERARFDEGYGRFGESAES